MDSFTSWENSFNLKESQPTKISGCAIAQGIQKKPAFYWWVYCVLKKRDRIISPWEGAVLSTLKPHKIGIELPKMDKEAFIKDQKNSNTILQDDISKEMEYVKVAF